MAPNEREDLLLRRLADLGNDMNRRLDELRTDLGRLDQPVFGNARATGLKATTATLATRVEDLEQAARRLGCRRWDLGRIAITAVVGLAGAATSAAIAVALNR